MAVARPILSTVALILLAGGVLLQLLVILSGAINGNPVNKIYFLQAGTGSISGNNVPNPARWTFFAVCGVVGGHNGNCLPVRAALPFDPVSNFGTSQGVPRQLVGTDTYYYLSRFAFAFFLIALFFAVCALLMSFIAICTRLGAFLTGSTTFLAIFFQALAAALMTAWAVKGERAFKNNGNSAQLGAYGFGFTWAALACFILAAILVFIGGGTDKKQSRNASSGYFGRKKSTRSTASRASAIDSETGNRGVKDEYE